MKGRVVLITGATNGIGRIAAERIAEKGASVTIVGRNPEKTEGVAKAIRDASGNAEVDHLIGDLSVTSEVERVAAEFRERCDRLDVLVNNAGAMFTSRHVTSEGFEMTFALNHLGYFVLTRELRSLLEGSAPARIINVASSAHKPGRIRWDDLQGEKRFWGFGRYCASKLMNVLFTFELARRLEGTGVTANCVHPGFIRSGFGKNDGALAKAMLVAGGTFAKTPERGAKGIVHLATSPDVEGMTGEYWVDHRVRRTASHAQRVEDQRRLWEVTETLLGG